MSAELAKPAFFVADRSLKASWRPGTLYAVDGGEGWLYYGQVTWDEAIGFLKFRSSQLVDIENIQSFETMCRVSVSRPSVGRALRDGYWKNLGTRILHENWSKPFGLAQCPVFTNYITASLHQFSGNKKGAVLRKWQTRIDDPEVQDFEVISSWDALFHMPMRLKADFGAESAPWHVIGPVRRFRKVREEYARRFPETPGHRLPPD